MIIDLSLLAFFLVSLFLFWYRLSSKIPELIAIPDQIITERFHDDSSRLRLFLLHLKIYYREGKHKLIFWKFIGKTLQKLHLLLLRVDNMTVIVIQKVRAHGISLNGSNGHSEEQYWQKVRQEVLSSSATTTIQKSSEIVRKPRRAKKAGESGPA